MKRFRSFLVLLVVLAYAGQALAAPGSPCGQMNHAAAGQMDIASMAHAGHQMPAHDDSGHATPAADCCESGLCAMSHCHSTPGVPPGHAGSSPQYAVLYPPIEDTAAPVHLVDSLYRPPISR